MKQGEAKCNNCDYLGCLIKNLCPNCYRKSKKKIKNIKK